MERRGAEIKRWGAERLILLACALSASALGSGCATVITAFAATPSQPRWTTISAVAVAPDGRLAVKIERDGETRATWRALDAQTLADRIRRSSTSYPNSVPLAEGDKAVVVENLVDWALSDGKSIGKADRASLSLPASFPASSDLQEVRVEPRHKRSRIRYNRPGCPEVEIVTPARDWDWWPRPATWAYPIFILTVSIDLALAPAEIAWLDWPQPPLAESAAKGENAGASSAPSAPSTRLCESSAPPRSVPRSIFSATSSPSTSPQIIAQGAHP